MIDNSKDKGQLTIHLIDTDNGTELCEIQHSRKPGEESFYIEYENGAVYVSSDGEKNIIGTYETSPGAFGSKVFDYPSNRVIGLVGNELIYFYKKGGAPEAGTIVNDGQCLAYYTKYGSITTSSKPIMTMGMINGSAIGGAAAFVAVFFSYNFKSVFRTYFETPENSPGDVFDHTPSGTSAASDSKNEPGVGQPASDTPTASVNAEQQGNDGSTPKEDWRELFDKAVDKGDQDLAVIYGSELLNGGELIHVMTGFKRLQELDHQKYTTAAMLYITLALRLSKMGRNNPDLTDFMCNPNLIETEIAARIADSYDNTEYDFDEYWDYLMFEHICWNIIAGEKAAGSKKAEYMKKAKNLMETTVIRHKGDWFNEYMAFFQEHPIDIEEVPTNNDTSTEDPASVVVTLEEKTLNDVPAFGETTKTETDTSNQPSDYMGTTAGSPDSEAQYDQKTENDGIATDPSAAPQITDETPVNDVMSLSESSGRKEDVAESPEELPFIKKNLISSTAFRFRWINGMCFEIKLNNGVTILTDPWYNSEEPGVLSEMAPAGFTLDDIDSADYIILTHTHADNTHNLLEVATKFGSTVITHSGNALELMKCLKVPVTNFYPVDYEGTYYFDGFVLETHHGSHYHNRFSLVELMNQYSLVGGMGGTFNLNFVITTAQGIRVAFIGGNDDGMMERMRGINKPNIIIRNVMASSSIKSGVSESIAEWFAAVDTQILIPMHYETWLTKDPEFTENMIADMNRIMIEKGLSGRVAPMIRGKWYTLDLSINEL